MEITEVRILLVDEEPLRVLVNIVLYNCFAIKELRIIRGPKGHFVGMPKRRKKDGTLSEIVSTITAEAATCWRRKCSPSMNKLLANRSPDINYLERRPTARQYKEVS